jgi:hypothetical protein
MVSSNFVDIINLTNENTTTSGPSILKEQREVESFCKKNLDCVEIRFKNLHLPNWEDVEILAMVKGKKMKHEANLIMFDSKDNMEISIIKYHDK